MPWPGPGPAVLHQLVNSVLGASIVEETRSHTSDGSSRCPLSSDAMPGLHTEIMARTSIGSSSRGFKGLLVSRLALDRGRGGGNTAACSLRLSSSEVSRDAEVETGEVAADPGPEADPIPLALSLPPAAAVPLGDACLPWCPFLAFSRSRSAYAYVCAARLSSMRLRSPIAGAGISIISCSKSLSESYGSGTLLAGACGALVVSLVFAAIARAMGLSVFGSTIASVLAATISSLGKQQQNGNPPPDLDLFVDFSGVLVVNCVYVSSKDAAARSSDGFVALEFVDTTVSKPPPPGLA